MLLTVKHGGGSIRLWAGRKLTKKWMWWFQCVRQNIGVSEHSPKEPQWHLSTTASARRIIHSSAWRRNRVGAGSSSYPNPLIVKDIKLRLPLKRFSVSFSLHSVFDHRFLSMCSRRHLSSTARRVFWFWSPELNSATLVRRTDQITSSKASSIRDHRNIFLSPHHVNISEAWRSRAVTVSQMQSFRGTFSNIVIINAVRNNNNTDDKLKVNVSLAENPGTQLNSTTN